MRPFPFKTVVRFLALWFAIHTIAIIVDGFYDSKVPADVAVILGSKVNPDRTLSLGLCRRLRKGLELFRGGQVKAIIVSGGLGSEGFNEATVMRDYLVHQGVLESAVIEDRAGNNTRLTALHARQIMNARGMKTAIVVSQYFHLSRTKLAFRQEGIVVASVHADYRVEIKDAWYLLREWPGYYSYLIWR